jgi:hypothetical protein
MIKNKKAAMEMSIGTIVTIVLLMSVMVLGLVLITNIFKSSETAVSSIDDKVTSKINDIFSKENVKVAVYPENRRITLSQGAKAKGFAFSINNQNTEDTQFKYTLYADTNYNYAKNCGSTFTVSRAENYISTKTSTVTIQGNMKMDTSRLMTFNIPEDAPKCEIPYNLKVEDMTHGGIYGQEIDIKLDIE